MTVIERHSGHPDWCDRPQSCEDDTDKHHIGLTDRTYVAQQGVRTDVSIMRYDTIVGTATFNTTVESTRVRLCMEDLESLDRAGNVIEVEAWMTPGEARSLAASLLRKADAAEIELAHPSNAAEVTA